MKTIKLTQNKKAIVNNKDYKYLSKFKWCAVWNGYTWYAVRHSSRNHYTRHTIWMHRQILKLEKEDKRQGHHRNKNGLDNRYENLCISNSSSNLRKRNPYGKTSKYQGIYWNKKARRWYAQLTLLNGEKLYIGSFISEAKAALEYKKYRKRYIQNDYH